MNARLACQRCSILCNLRCRRRQPPTSQPTTAPYRRNMTEDATHTKNRRNRENIKRTRKLHYVNNMQKINGKLFACIGTSFVSNERLPMKCQNDICRCTVNPSHGKFPACIWYNVCLEVASPLKCCCCWWWRWQRRCGSSWCFRTHSLLLVSNAMI